jgi:transposase
MSITVAIGIDIAKTSFTLCWAQSLTTLSAIQTFENAQTGYDTAHALLTGHAVLPATSLVVMEATSVYWEACACWFHQHGYQVSVVNPARVAAFARSELRRRKTDALDAALLVRFAFRMQPACWQPPAHDMEALHQLMRQREAYVQIRTQLQNQRHAGMHHASPCQEAVASLQRTLDALANEITALEEAIKRRFAAHPEWQAMLDRLMTMTGVGLVVATTLVIETHGLRDFHSSAQLCAYAGISPVLCRSGTSVHQREHISKIGNPHVRKAAYHAAVWAVRHCQPLREFYDRLLKRHKPKKVARVAVARKILRIAFALITHEQDFDPEFLSKNMKKHT